MAWHLAAITLTRGGRCNIAHCPPPIYSNGPLSSRRSSFFPLPSALPRLHTHTLDALLLPFDFYFPFLSFFPPPSTSSVLRRGEPRVRRASPLFRHAREPLISADFARRVDPWNPCSCLSPAPARAGTSFHPSFLLALSFSPSAPSSSSSSLHSLSFAFVSTRRSRRKVFRRYRPLFQESGKRISFFLFFSLYTKIVGYCILGIGGRQCKF